MKKEELRKIPKKNYIILGIIILVSLLLVYYFYMWIDAYNETKLNKPILNKYMEVINYNELDNYLVERPNTIIYVSVLENSEIREFEKKFKSVLKSHRIDAELLYMDVTEELKDDEVKKEMASKYALNNTNITDVPVIIVFDNGELSSIYNISSNDYDIDGLKTFLEGITFTTEDEIDG